MKVTVIPIIIGVFRTIPKCSIRQLEELEIRGQAEIIQTIALLISNRILRWVLETGGGGIAVTPVKDHKLTLVWKTRKE